MASTLWPHRKSTQHNLHNWSNCGSYLTPAITSTREQFLFWFNRGSYLPLAVTSIREQFYNRLTPINKLPYWHPSIMGFLTYWANPYYTLLQSRPSINLFPIYRAIKFVEVHSCRKSIINLFAIWAIDYLHSLAAQ